MEYDEEAELAEIRAIGARISWRVSTQEALKRAKQIAKRMEEKRND